MFANSLRDQSSIPGQVLPKTQKMILDASLLNTLQLRSFNIKTVLFQVIQFSISTQFSSIWPIDRTLSSATTPDQSKPGSDGNKKVLCIPQSSSISGTSPSDCLVSYPGHSLVEEGTPLQRCSQCILHPHLTEQDCLGYMCNKLVHTKILQKFWLNIVS